MKKVKVNVFITKLENFNYSRYTKLLSKHRITKIDGANSEEFITEQIMGELLLIYALKKLSDNVTVPLVFNKTNNGKPYLINHNYFYNISHTNNYFSIAISNNKIGIDSESLNRKIKNLEEKILTPNELFVYNKKSNKSFLIKTWTKKEAIVKLNGEQIVKNLLTIDTTTKYPLFNGVKSYLKEIKYNDLYTVVASNIAFKIKVYYINENKLVQVLNNLL